MEITNFNKIFPKMSYDLFMNSFFSKKGGKLPILEATKFYSLPQNHKKSEKDILLKKFNESKKLNINRNIAPVPKEEETPDDIKKINKKNIVYHSCQKLSAKKKNKYQRIKEIRNHSQNLYYDFITEDRTKENMDNILIQNSLMLIRRLKEAYYNKEYFENIKKINFPFVMQKIKKLPNSLPIIQNAKDNNNNKENQNTKDEDNNDNNGNKDKNDKNNKDNIDNIKEHKKENNQNKIRENFNNKDNLNDNNNQVNIDDKNDNKKINKKICENQSDNGIEDLTLGLKNDRKSLLYSKYGRTFSKIKTRKRNLSINNENKFEYIKKDLFNLNMKTLPAPLLITPSKEHYIFNFYVNKTYRKQIPLYMKHRINWNFVKNKEEGYSLRWKYYPGRVNYKAYQYNPNMPIDKIKMISVFERYKNLGNKENFFINFIKYCNRNEINPFNYIPFTIVLNKAFLFEKSLKNLEEINNLLNKKKSNFNNDKIPYTKLFPLSKLTGNSNRDFDELFIYIHDSFTSNYNYWIVKPPDLFQGMGIKVFKDFKEIKEHCESLFHGIEKVTAEQEEYCKKHNIELNPKIHKSEYILIQKYLDSPLLYYGRKFDIRCYVLVDYCFNVFICREGHLKACSQKYDLNNLDVFTHITNYSLQKRCKDFAKYEQGNEISYKKFIELLDITSKGKGKIIFNKIFNKMKEEIKLSMNSVGRKLKGVPKVLSFQIIGYDFIVDQKYNPWILEINDNPGIEISSELISHLIPRMIDDAIRLTVDKVFPTEYDKEVISEDGKNYVSKYHLDGFNDEENVFEFLCNVDHSFLLRDINKNAKTDK